MNENGEYRYSYEDYNRISYNPDATLADLDELTNRSLSEIVEARQ